MNDLWTAVIPVKRLGLAKSRLRGAVPAARHQDLALAMLADTAAAVLACAEIGELVVVTDDPEAVRITRELGARPVADEPDAGLNAAFRFGADVIAGTGRNRVALAGDLPAVRPAELGEALRSVRGRAFVADAAGTGTVLLGVRQGSDLDPRFGIGSAAAHAGSGATALTGDWPGLRQDVDTAADLREVMALGAGPRTCGLLRDLGLISSCLPAA
ncbi:2-phospho-L-lactate guanylyltransferase [Actinoplanes sp. NBRC 103695]|uniref:2-phospho-L-lactate guanylyltransferase n=1 Tax=Actinoplanes sp. NBRC 103695 TaxID=3032202 RepID=UPI0024A43CE0|nr:2-phospho-L-lactate guanylyltransferase [Actinoplanes sp. NBRC 103695]GLY94569.1 2-phospho-L-lactate guanylyltransferase [Actinoplanes sp. NBRC 103695]